MASAKTAPGHDAKGKLESAKLSQFGAKFEPTGRQEDAAKKFQGKSCEKKNYTLVGGLGLLAPRLMDLSGPHVSPGARSKTVICLIKLLFRKLFSLQRSARAVLLHLAAWLESSCAESGRQAGCQAGCRGCRRADGLFCC